MTHEEIQQRIIATWPDAHIDIFGSDCNLTLHIVSAGFVSMGRLQRQRAVMKLFADEMDRGEIHALSIRALAPGE